MNRKILLFILVSTFSIAWNCECENGYCWDGTMCVSWGGFGGTGGDNQGGGVGGGGCGDYRHCECFFNLDNCVYDISMIVYFISIVIDQNDLESHLITSHMDINSDGNLNVVDLVLFVHMYIIEYD